MRTLGIDIGSRFIKVVLMKDGNILSFKKAETSFNPLEICCELLRDLQAERIIATGYGRHLFEIHKEINTITEIKAFAIGARAIFPQCRTIIDIGGQDTKVIGLDERGNVKKFEMNDRCAAGTGRFLEIMAKTLGYQIEQFGIVSLNNHKEIQISSMCTVFAESEIISLISKGVNRQDIALAINRTIANRVISMLRRINIEDDVVFGGGCANNQCLKNMLERNINRTIKVPSVPEMIGALGAAIYAQKEGSPIGVGPGLQNPGIPSFSESWIQFTNPSFRR